MAIALDTIFERFLSFSPLRWAPEIPVRKPRQVLSYDLFCWEGGGCRENSSTIKAVSIRLAFALTPYYSVPMNSSWSTINVACFGVDHPELVPSNEPRLLSLNQ